MSLMLKKESYPYFEISPFENTECSVDTEYFLPDYCPDIQRILKCSASADIISYSVSQDKMMIQGNLNIIVMYLDEKGECIRNCELSKEFTSNFKINGHNDKSIVYLKTFCGHIICRAVSARKLDIHIPVNVSYSFCRINEFEYTEDAKDCEKREQYITASKALRAYSKESTVAENLELSNSMKPIEAIIRRDIEFLDVKAVATDDAVEITSTIEITAVYRSYSENSAIEKLKYQVPFNERIELTGVDRDTEIKCNIIKGELSIQPKEDSMGDNTILSLFTKFSINLLTFKSDTFKLISDVFPLSHQSLEKFTKHNFKTYFAKENSVSQSVDVTLDNIEKIIDIWCENPDVNTFYEQNKLNYRGKYNVNILYSNQEKKINYLTKSVDFISQINLKDSNFINVNNFVKAKVCDYKITGASSLNIKCEILIDSFAERIESVKALENSEVGKELTDAKGRLNIIYEKNELSLWDIAKSHRVSVQDIMDINSFISEEEISFPIMIYKN